MSDAPSSGTRVARGLTASLALATVMGFLGGAWWVFDLFDHFRVQYAVCLVALGALALARRRFRLAIAAGLVAAPNAFLVIDSVVGGRDAERLAGAPPVSLVLANVNSANTDYDAIVSYVLAKDADIVVILEVDAGWEVALRERLPDYRHGVVEARRDNFGLALLAKAPFEHVATRALTPGGPSVGLGRVRFGDRAMTVVATHVVPPSGAAGTAARDAQLRALGALAVEAGPEAVVLGDLNTTPWSRPFRALMAVGLTDTREGFGVHATWPTGFFPLRIPIDHVATGASWVAAAREVGPDVGSDHYPVYVALVPAR